MTYTGKQLSKITGIDPRHVWHDVRSRGIQPEKPHGIYVLTQAQYEKWTQLRADNYRAPRPAPGLPRSLTNGEKAIAPPRPFTVTAGKKVTAAQLERNRQQIARVEALVRDGEVKPRVVPAGAAVPQPWQWSAGI